MENIFKHIDEIIKSAPPLTIDINGNIGAVGGLNEKIVTAINYEVDIFFVGSYNYEEALVSYNLHNATFDLVKVETFSDIIEYLNCFSIFEELETQSGKFFLSHTVPSKEMMLDLVSQEMEHAMELLVPLKAEACASTNWYEVK